MANRPPGMLEPLRIRIRRLQLIVGIGFLSLVIGAVITVGLTAKVAPRLEGIESVWLRLCLSMLMSGVWVYAVLPALCYGAARVIDLRPWSTAIGAAITGELFSAGIFFVTGAFEDFASTWRLMLPRLVLVAFGSAFAAWAIRRGRVDASVGEGKAKAAAAAKKDEYAEFTREAERIAAKHDAPGASAPAPSSIPAPSEPQAPSQGSGSAAPTPVAAQGGGLSAPATRPDAEPAGPSASDDPTRNQG